MRALVDWAIRVGNENHGTALVETSLALLLAFPVMISAFELCMFTYTQAILGDAARVGVRYAIVHGSDSSACSGPSGGCSDKTAANVVQTVQHYAANSLSSLGSVSVSPSYIDASSAPSSRIIVTVTYNYAPLFQFSAFSMAMSASAEGRIVY